MAGSRDSVGVCLSSREAISLFPQAMATCISCEVGLSLGRRMVMSGVSELRMALNTIAC